VTLLLFTVPDRPAEGNGVAPAEFVVLGRRGSGVLKYGVDSGRGSRKLSKRHIVRDLFVLLPSVIAEFFLKALVRICEWVIDDNTRIFRILLVGPWKPVITGQIAADESSNEKEFKTASSGSSASSTISSIRLSLSSSCSEGWVESSSLRLSMSRKGSSLSSSSSRSRTVVEAASPVSLTHFIV
jgi:hypothetical protein